MQFDVGTINESFTRAQMTMTRYQTAWNLSLIQEKMPEIELQNSTVAASILKRLYEDFTGAAQAGQFEMGMYAAALLTEWGNELIQWALDLQAGNILEPPWHDWDLARIPVRVSALEVPQEYVHQVFDQIGSLMEEGEEEERRRRKKERRKKKKKKKKRNPALGDILEIQTEAKNAIHKLRWLWGHVIRLRGIKPDELPYLNMEYGEVLALEYQASTFLAYGYKDEAVKVYKDILERSQDINGFLQGRMKQIQKFGKLLTA